jgi:hypothetical protein
LLGVYKRKKEIVLKKERVLKEVAWTSCGMTSEERWVVV